MPVQSSGLLLYRRQTGTVEILIGHMGGPFWARKHEHAWSIPKGIHDDGETDALAVAEREFAEELGRPAPPGESHELGSVTAGRKRITIFAREGDFDADAIVSNTFELEWPRGSGTMVAFPEIDRAAWVSLDEATSLLTKGQQKFIDLLRATLDGHQSVG